MWGWTGAFSLWQGLSFTRTMRYQLPIYPDLAIIAAWSVFALWEAGKRHRANAPRRAGIERNVAIVAGTLGVLGTALWAFAFVSIYARPLTRVEASAWIYQNVPGPINLEIQTPDGQVQEPLGTNYSYMLSQGANYRIPFVAEQDATVASLTLPALNYQPAGQTGEKDALQVSLLPAAAGTPLGQAELALAGVDLSKPLTLDLHSAVQLAKGQSYALVFDLFGPGSVTLSGQAVLDAYGSSTEDSLALDNVALSEGLVQFLAYTPSQNGLLRGLQGSVGVQSTSQGPLNLAVTVLDAEHADQSLAQASATLSSAESGFILQLPANQQIALQAGHPYLLGLRIVDQTAPVTLSGTLSLNLLAADRQQALPPITNLISAERPWLSNFTATASGEVTAVTLGYALDNQGSGQPTTMQLGLFSTGSSAELLANSSASVVLGPQSDPRGVPVNLALDRPTQIEQGKTYTLQLSVVGQGAVGLHGSAPANESSWDDGLPVNLGPLAGYAGIYQNDLNFEMYWDDNADKLQRFLTTLNQSDYIFISSNRQWASIPRVPERYPLTTFYYRELLGCPPEADLLACYRGAEPGMFQGQLGFDLVKVFESEPTLGPLTISTQSAEEAFTVYDHPKVFIFKKSASYDAQKVAQLLGSVDLSNVVHVTPRQAKSFPANLMLPSNQLAVQQAGGTWSQLFDVQGLQNRYPWLTVILWYLAISVLGWANYPLTRTALRGLDDHGFPFTRLVGLLLLAWLAWMAGSFGIPYSQATIGICFAGLLAVNGTLAYVQRKDLAQEWQERKGYFLRVELFALTFFLADLLIRLGNPDLWHPFKGGEKPMDFSYLNAVLKSTSFPPYDPWFSGGYINYYYYGYVLVGTPVKALGIVPSVAYNLILPMLFSVTGLGAFSIGWNLSSAHRKSQGTDEHALRPWIAGLAAALAVLVLGNLGSMAMILNGFVRLGAGGQPASAGLGQVLARGVQGIGKFLSGTPMPYAPSDWYWIPSRTIPGEPITEFPFFTFLYADLHAHLIALPVTLLAIGWSLSVVFGAWRWGGGSLPAWLRFAGAFLLGGLVIGALRATNTWDFPTYLLIGSIAVLYTAVRYGRDHPDIFPYFSPGVRRSVFAVLAVALLAGLSLVLYQPFANWYGQGYSSISIWKAGHTPLSSYFVHWGLFLFVLLSWLVWETRDWLANTPASALNKLAPYRGLILAGLLVFVAAVLGLAVAGIPVGLIALPMAVWALVLIFRPGQSEAKRAVLLLTAGGLLMTLMVELIVLQGDIGRMNTVFKFYFQAWVLLGLSAAMALVWLWPAVVRLWSAAWRNSWRVVFGILLFSAALFPLLGGADKIRDRMAPDAPHVLDGMAYMDYATYSDQGAVMDLSEDAAAIRWMQENVQGSPVIVEGNTPEYRWGSRFTIYTGLPGVVGWNWHQRQQRNLVPSNWVTDRIDDIARFYTTTDAQEAQAFLQKYHVSYIIVGQLEHIYYPGPGLDKFEALDGQLWQKVYQNAGTVIYRVRGSQG
jgi:YYY domain-containing protein